MAPKPMTNVPIRERRRRLETHTHREDGHMKTEQRLQCGSYKPRNAKDFREPPETRREAEKELSLTVSERNQPCQHRDTAFLLF